MCRPPLTTSTRPIVASEVVNDSSDVGQLHAMAKAAKDALGAEVLQVLADEGYYSSTELKACEDDGIVAYVPVPEGAGRLGKQGSFSLNDFGYDEAADVYRCPAGERLRPMKGRWQNTSGRIEIRDAQLRATCRTCPLKARCLSPKASRRTIARWEHEDVLERHRARMQGAGEVDAPPFQHCRAPLWDPQTPRRIPPFPGSRLLQGSRRMEPDGALLQLHPRAQHPRFRALRRLHGSKGARTLRTRSSSRPACCSARSGGLLGTHPVYGSKSAGSAAF